MRLATRIWILAAIVWLFGLGLCPMQAFASNNAKFVCDGSQCTDPFYLPMQFQWTGYESFDGGPPTTVVFTATDMITTNVFNIGSYLTSLRASDAIATGPGFDFNMQVITAGQAANTLIADVQTSGLPINMQRKLIGPLASAAGFFNHGQMAAGGAAMEAFMQPLKTSHFSGETTSNLLQSAQAIIDAL